MNASVSWNEQKAKIETNCTKLFGTEVWSEGRRKDEQRHRDTHLGGCGAGAGVGATAGAGGTTRLGLAISSPAPKMKCIYINLTSHPPNLSLVKSELGLRCDEADTYWTCSFSNPVTWKETTGKCKKSKTGILKLLSYLDPTFFHPCMRISNKTKKDALSCFILFFLKLKLPSVFEQSKGWRSEAELRLHLIRLHSVALHMSGHDLHAFTTLGDLSHFSNRHSSVQ